MWDFYGTLRFLIVVEMSIFRSPKVPLFLLTRKELRFDGVLAIVCCCFLYSNLVV